MSEKKMPVDVECYSPFICLSCPVFDLDTATLFAGDEPYERHFRCSHLPFCQKLLPNVDAFYEAKLSAKEKPPVGTSRWIHDGPSFRGGVDWWHCDNCGKWCREFKPDTIFVLTADLLWSEVTGMRKFWLRILRAVRDWRCR